MLWSAWTSLYEGPGIVAILSNTVPFKFDRNTARESIAIFVLVSNVYHT